MNNNLKRAKKIFSDKMVIPFLRNKFSSNETKYDFGQIVNFYIESLNKYKNLKICDTKNKRMIFFIPDFGISSGGHTTIFRIAAYFESIGYEISLVICGYTSYSDKQYLFYLINEYFVKFNPKIFLSMEEYLKSKIGINDILFATSWHTAYILNRFPELFKNKFYLVQDYEAQFNPISSLYYFAENTYKMGFYHICASKWLAEMIKNKFNGKADYFNLGCDDVYFKSNKKDFERDFSIIYYSRWETPRRGYELVSCALNLIQRKYPKLKIKLYGSNNIYQAFKYENLGILTKEELANEYKKSLIGLSMSLTNVSLIPTEMMACGLPVIEFDHPSVRSMYDNDKEILLSSSDPQSICNNIEKLIKSDKLRKLLVTNSYEKVKTKYSWELSFKKIHLILKKSIATD